VNKDKDVYKYGEMDSKVYLSIYVNISI